MSIHVERFHSVHYENNSEKRKTQISCRLWNAKVFPCHPPPQICLRPPRENECNINTILLDSSPGFFLFFHREKKIDFDGGGGLVSLLHREIENCYSCWSSQAVLFLFLKTPATKKKKRRSIRVKEGGHGEVVAMEEDGWVRKKDGAGSSNEERVSPLPPTSFMVSLVDGTYPSSLLQTVQQFRERKRASSSCKLFLFCFPSLSTRHVRLDKPDTTRTIIDNHLVAERTLIVHASSCGCQSAIQNNNKNYNN